MVFDDLLEMYYGNDKNNWPKIRIRISDSLEVSGDTFESLPTIIEIGQIIKKDNYKVRAAVDEVPQKSPLSSLTDWDARNQEIWNKLEDLYRED